MNKIWLILSREFVTRVRKPSFILATLLTPIGIGLIALLAGYFASKGAASAKSIIVKDESGIFKSNPPENSSHTYVFSNDSIETLKESYKEENDILVFIEPISDLTKKRHQALFYSEEKLSISTIGSIEKSIAESVKNYKIEQSNIDKTVYESFNTKFSLENGVSLEDDPKASGKLSVIIGTILGALMGFLMYMVIFIYGGMVMRSVMEEKINRIVELMISSVKPFQLMMGKILGVGAVGLLQLGIWIVLVPVILFTVQMVTGAGMGIENSSQLQEITSQMNSPEVADQLENFKIAEIIKEFRSQNWVLIIPVFILFFFGGFFIYASLFAAIGSAIGDDMGESQQLMLPIMIPVILAFIMMQGVIQNPNGGMAVFGSLFPLFSPIIMPARLAFDPPLWQVGLSLVILIASCIFFAWFAGRIYRIGILLYGKKVNLRELGKWLFYKP